jgi:hypothetical protein
MNHPKLEPITPTVETTDPPPPPASPVVVTGASAESAIDADNVVEKPGSDGGTVGKT